MATKIVTKNSSTASAVPTASDLVQGELAVNVADKRLFTEDNAGAIVELGTNPSGNVTFQDNGKAIFGAGDDLQIYHDGSNSYINDAGTGNLYLRASNAIIMQSADGAETIASFHDDNLCRLYFDNAIKLATTSTGIDVTGNVTMATGGSIVAGGVNDLILNAGESGTPDIYLQSGSSTKVKIEGSNGNVGIGCTPSRELDIQASSGWAELALRGVSGSSGSLEYYNASTKLAEIYADTSTNIIFRNSTNGTTEAMRIDSSGNALVGRTSSLSGQSGSVSANTVLSAHGGLSAHATSAGILEHYNDETILRSYGANAGSGELVFKTGGGGGSADSEAARIDSSGTLLIGTSDGSGAGLEISKVHGVRPSVINNVAGIFNRMSSDGPVAIFRKDGTTVGSIGTQGGDLYLGTDDANIKFYNSASIQPVNSVGGVRDNAIDIGASSARFKDLYLSGGVYLGGTGAANKLDDYEEGTWTPVTNSGSWTVNSASYTKVGNTVTCHFKITVTSTISANDFTGLPFTPQNESAGVCGYQNSESGEVYSIAVQSGNVWNFRVASTQKGLVNGALAYGTFTYQTTA